jgi:hypothetical protein
LGAACVGLSEVDAILFRGGLIAVDLCALAVIVACVHPGARLLPRVLSFEPLRVIGTRSYGLYLWHWPVFALLRPGIDVALDAPQALALRLLLSALLTELSYRFIEEPVRSGRWLSSVRNRIQEARRRGAPWLRRAVMGGVLCSLVLSCAYVTRAFVLAEPPAETSYALNLPKPSEPRAEIASSAPTLSAAPNPQLTRSADAAAPAREPTVLVFGDSVVLGASRYLRAGHETEVEFDSEVGRTSSTALPHLRKLASTNKLRRVMILHLGNNGWLYEEQVHEIMALLAHVERVIFINAHVPKRWGPRNNATLATALAQHPNAILIDWAKASEKHREWFGSDDLHLTHSGAEAFAALVMPYYSFTLRD